MSHLVGDHIDCFSPMAAQLLMFSLDNQVCYGSGSLPVVSAKTTFSEILG